MTFKLKMIKKLIKLSTDTYIWPYIYQLVSHLKTLTKLCSVITDVILYCTAQKLGYSQEQNIKIKMIFSQ